MFSHGLRVDRQALERLQAPPEEAKEAIAGWDEDRVKGVIKHYQSQSEDEAVAEDEVAFAVDEILVQVPAELVPKVRALIAKEQAKR